jgi:hypothetical protein
MSITHDLHNDVPLRVWETIGEDYHDAVTEMVRYMRQHLSLESKSVYARVLKLALAGTTEHYGDTFG